MTDETSESISSVRALEKNFVLREKKLGSLNVTTASATGTS